jgi:autotransporter-associated beta strand protein
LALVSFFALAALAASPRAYAEPREYYQTEEFFANFDQSECDKLSVAVCGALGYINADAAYALGYTGAGVVVGVIDSNYFLGHSEFADKLDSGGERYGFDYGPEEEDIYRHGVHVAGIIAANKDDAVMHGVAFGADFFTVVPIETSLESGLNAFLGLEDIYIINNSWGEDYTDLKNFNPTGDLLESVNSFLNNVNQLIEQRDVLLVFSSGNDGSLSPIAPSSFPSLVKGTTLWDGTAIESFPERIANDAQAYRDAGLIFDENNLAGFGDSWKNNIISVGSFNFRYDSNSVLFISPFSNLFDGASEYGLLAPGQEILSTIPYEDGALAEDRYVEMSGTSMATPYVSGVAALVREAFPYFEGKQIGDVLLSTAQKLTTLDNQLPPFLILREQVDENTHYFVAYTYEDAIGQSSFYADNYEDIVEFVDVYFKSNPVYLAQVEDALKIENLVVMPTDKYEGLFGQGIVDAGKAALGPGYFDAGRLNWSDVLELEDGAYEALLYRVDTQGSDSLWGNDIGEKRSAFAESPELLPVGLEKSGLGVLTLSGDNSYLGPTLVQGGEIRLEEGSIAGRVEVAPGATLSGAGDIGGLGAVAGELSPGLADDEYGLLTFANGLTLESSATIVFDLGSAGAPGTDYDSVAVTGGSLVLAGTLEAIAASLGTYAIFNYDGATYAGDVANSFSSIVATVGGESAKGTLAQDAFASLITLTLSVGQQTLVTRVGDGVDSNLEDSGYDQAGLVVTFTGTGETVTVLAPTHFDALLFDVDGYVLDGDDLTIDPASSNAGIVNVNGSSYEATIENNIGGAGQSLIKVGDGLLILEGENAYTGGTVIEAGTLRGEIVAGTNLTVAGGAVYDAGGAERAIAALNGEGDIVNATGLTVASGTFGGDLDNSNSGGLTKVGTGELFLDGGNIAYTGGTVVLGGTLKGDIAVGTDLTVAVGAIYDGAGAARRVGDLDGAGAVTNTAGLTASSGSFSGVLDGTNTGGITKVGVGVLELAGANNEYEGGATVLEGTLKGAIAYGTDLTVAAGATYDGAGAARLVGNLGGAGDVKNTNGLTVSSGTFSGVLDGTNTGGLVKIGAGDLTLAGENSYGGGATVSEGRLIGDARSLQGVINIQSPATLLFSQALDGAFVGQIYGAGNFVKDGLGSLSLNGSHVAGDVKIDGGGLIVGDSLANNASTLTAALVTVNAGGLLGGHGTIVADASIRAGGSLSPGNSYGQISFDGNLTFESDSFFDVEVNPFDINEGDLTTVTGTATLAGTVRHFQTGGTVDDYAAPGVERTIMTAASLVGEFAGAVSNLAFLKPELRYDATNVYLSFARSSSFSDLGDTPNRSAVAAALESLEPGSALYREIVGSATLDQAGTLLDELSGEAHSAIGGGLFQLGASLDNAIFSHVGVLSRLRAETSAAPSAGDADGSGRALWASVGESRSVLRGSATTAKSTLTGPEVAIGYDGSYENGWLGGLAIQYSDKKMKMDGRRSEADIRSFTFGLYGGKGIFAGPGVLRLIVSGAFSRHDVESTRRALIGAQDQTLRADYAANSLRANLEVAYRFPANQSLDLEPFVRLGWQRLRSGGFEERGGSAALKSASANWNHAVSATGLRLSLADLGRVSLSASLAWGHSFGRQVPAYTYAFRDGGNGFSVQGSPLSRDEALVGLDLGLRAADSVSLRLGYDGAFGSRSQSHGGRATLEIQW